MHEDFWIARWARNEIGFHQDEINPYLRRHWPALGLTPGARVLVPLCGKSLDLVWLAGQGLRVLGVELVERAVEDFFAEQDLQPQVSASGPFKVYSSGNLQIFCGDIFALSPADVADCQAVYDRAALIAFPPEMRERYAAHLSGILPSACQGLLVTLDYDQAQRKGPPFAVSDVEVRRLLAADWSLEVLEEQDLSITGKFHLHGLSRLDERVYRLVRR